MRKKYSLFNFQFSIGRNMMMILLIVMVASCGFFRSPERERCRKILPRETVTDILTDIYLMEGYLSDYQTIRPTTRDSVDYFYGGIFVKHGVSKNEFQQALDCYLLFASEMEKIHEEILNRLSIKMSEAEAELERYMRRQEEERLQADSLALDSLPTDTLPLFFD